MRSSTVPRPLQVLHVQAGTKFRRRLDLLRFQRGHVGDAVHHHADHAVGDVEDDHHGGLVIGNVAQFEFDAHVHDRDDDAAQIDHALDEFGRVGDGGDGFVAAYLLHLEDVDAIFLAAQRERSAARGLRRSRIVHGLFA